MPVEDIDLRLDDNLNDNDQNLQLGEVQNDISSQNLDTKIIKSNSNKKEYKINIPPDSKPIVVLCGPPNSGKSMIIKCLADYLYDSSELGYSIKANRNLIADDDYQLDCKIFDSSLGQEAPFSNTTNFLLADVLDKDGNIQLYFLEAPGEHYFSLDKINDEPDLPFKHYLSKVATNGSGVQRKVIYVILLDLDSPISFRRHKTIREKYQKKMIKLYDNYVKGRTSKVILLYNKVDIPQGGLWANSNGVFNLSSILQDAKGHYPNFFNNFTQKKLGFFTIDNFTFLPFCTGTYNPDENGNKTYTSPGSYYPATLWKELVKRF